MPKSMTGYGRGTSTGEGLIVTVEVRSTNHRYRDISVRIPRELAELEDKLRALVAESLARGHVDVSVTVEEAGAPLKTVEVRMDLAQAYHAAAKDLAARLGIAGEVGVETILSLQDVVTVKPVSVDPDAAWQVVKAAANQALEALARMRAAEGESLARDLVHRTSKIEQLIARISERAPVVAEEYRARLEARLRELLADVPIDETRIAMEAAIYADKINVTEELVRLASHIAQVHSVIEQAEPAGRRLEFLVQEMHREANTIGSKSQDVEISHMVVEIKSELEKIREQIQNIE
ncbi:MAG TPA: YicC family protein [Firmicutes bacterium]|nr:YicC family protein [Bacillota bacterium]